MPTYIIKTTVNKRIVTHFLRTNLLSKTIALFYETAKPTYTLFISKMIQIWFLILVPVIIKSRVSLSFPSFLFFCNCKHASQRQSPNNNIIPKNDV